MFSTVTHPECPPKPKEKPKLPHPDWTVRTMKEPVSINNSDGEYIWVFCSFQYKTTLDEKWFPPPHPCNNGNAYTFLEELEEKDEDPEV